MDEVQAKLEDVEQTIMYLTQRIAELSSQLREETLVRDELLTILADNRGKHAHGD